MVTGVLRPGAMLSLLTCLAVGCAPDPGAPPVGSTPTGDAGFSAADAAPHAATLTAIELSAQQTSLAVTASVAVQATGVFTDGRRVDLTTAATWHVSSTTVAEVLAGGVVVGVAAGRARVWASRGAVRSASLDVTVTDDRDEGELRGVWVTRWTFSSAADIQRIVDDVDAAHLNAIFEQVRGTADAYYASSHEPWAKRLTGTLGQDPGWDPLAQMVDLAHAKGIAVHAWLNTFPAWTGDTAPTESDPRHPLLEHPDWLCANDAGEPMPLGGQGYQFFSPGNPAVRAHIALVAEDLATSYAIDGLHFDYVRYPGRSYCHDAASTAAFAAASAADPALTYADFQRAQITTLLGDVRARLNAAGVRTAITVASWGIHKNEWQWSGVSRGFDDYFQAAHQWARSGLVDALCPMTYWRITDPKGGRTDFATLSDDHVAAAAEGGRYAFMGISSDHDADELLDQVAVARQAGARGVVFFELGGLRTDGHLDRLVRGPFAERATLPRMPWR